MKLFKKNLLIPLIFLTVVIVLQKLWSIFPGALETLYQGIIFTGIRNIYDYLIGIWLPFPMLWISLLGIIYFVFIKKKKYINWWDLSTNLLGNIISFVALFYLLWGWNYAQRSVAERLDIRPNTVDSLELYQEAQWAVQEINSLRIQLQDDSLVLSVALESKVGWEDKVRSLLSASLDGINYPTPGRPRVRVLKPKGFLLRFKTAGIYIPYAFEGHIDGGMMEVEWPFTMAHEMSHAYGVTDEGECNFTAFLACMRSDDLLFRYSAMIDYGLYVLRDVYRVNPAVHQKFLKELHPGYRADLKAIRTNNNKYPDILPDIRDFMYDSYLKSNGVKAGLQSYSQLVNLVIEFKKKNEIQSVN